jgi:hypothetical protein
MGEPMQRRTLLKLAALSGLDSVRPSLLPALAARAHVEPVPIKTVLLVTKCHLDVGFSLTQAKVIREYFEVYYPAAMRIAADLRQAGNDRYTWTTGSWLLYEYLEQASAGQRKAMEEAIAAGDITWHALPFTWQTEMLDRSMIEGALGLSASLDRRFGRKTVGAKMTDVPGHSRGLVGPLQAAGVRLLDIGINPASTPPDVPDVFLWKDTQGSSLAVMYHRHDYGSLIEVPGTGIAVDVEVRSDNSGPHTPAEIATIYARLRLQYPGAEIKASNLNEVAAVVDRVRDKLPVVTGEVGDTWIYGCASDPDKVARYRELARLRKAWLAQGKFASGDATDRDLLRRLLLAVEHTWGTDTKTYLDYDHYGVRDLAEVLQKSGYVVMEESWKEKREDIDAALASLPPGLRQEADARLALLRAGCPAVEGMVAHDAAAPVQAKHFAIAFDPSTGAITRLQSRKTGRDWASPQHPLALMTYQTLSADQYSDFLKRYLTIKTDWAPRDFGKPGIAKFNAEAREWHPKLIHCWTASTGTEDRVVLELAIDDPQALASGNVAWPAQIFLEMRLPHDEASLEVRAVTLGKVENRMPEALWFSFVPAGSGQGAWEMEKVDQPVGALDVVRGGGRAMHAVTESVRYRGEDGHVFEVRALDAPVVALGERTPLDFSMQQPDLSHGLHFSLFNNAWGTNYPQWCGGDWAYRFRILA